MNQVTSHTWSEVSANQDSAPSCLTDIIAMCMQLRAYGFTAACMAAFMDACVQAIAVRGIPHVAEGRDRCVRVRVCACMRVCARARVCVRA